LPPGVREARPELVQVGNEPSPAVGVEEGIGQRHWGSERQTRLQATRNVHVQVHHHVGASEQADAVRRAGEFRRAHTPPPTRISQIPAGLVSPASAMWSRARLRCSSCAWKRGTTFRRGLTAAPVARKQELSRAHTDTRGYGGSPNGAAAEQGDSAQSPQRRAPRATAGSTRPLTIDAASPLRSMRASDQLQCARCRAVPASAIA
jgi:hypothetical protein